ncbi:putative Transposon TX1 [Gossypium australe]|uniref:Putative Transposon TX1 n=1 Tax=Gossypium australe TaxID=47621 RepID=A0A5B6WIE0_9ROSI|nr:putative Transposon TX1 [Gossypium australe]
MVETLKHLTSNIKDWNKSIYNHIGSQLQVKEELECILHHEELLWKQKAHCDWLNIGDQNTKFFYSCIILRRKHNRISVLKYEEDN